MKIQKLLTIILIFGICLLLVSCQPSIRFASEKQANNDKQNNRNVVEKNENNDAKNVANVTQNSQNRGTTFYNRPAQVIPPTSKIGKNSSQIVSIAKGWIGVPYKFGGTTRQGIDCSAFVRNVYSEIGINLPRTSGEQFAFATPTNNPVVGDLVFFRRNGRIHHVGIYIGNKQIIHSSINRGVMIESIVGNSLERTFAGYGRVGAS